MFDKISSGKIYGNVGNTFAAIEIDGNGVVIKNAADEYDSSGNLVAAGSDEVLSASRSTGTTINASYIKTGVIDANLLRAGLIQTVPSWNTKWYGAPEDHAAVQMGFTGGSIAATAVSTGTGTVSLTLPGGHGLITGDYVRVSGLFFTTGTLLGGVGLNLPTNGPLDYASATVATNTLTYSKTDITSGLTASTASTVYVGKAHAITAVVRSFDNPENPAELSTVVVTTSAAHGLSVGNYVELVNVAPTIDGVAYITAVTSTTFTFKQRFGADINLDLSGSDLVLPSLSAPVAVKVLKSYTQNADGSIVATSGSIGGFTLSSTSLTAGTGASAVGLLPGTFPFFAGSSTASTAPFRVGNTGDLTATNVTIVGANDTSVNTTATAVGSMTTGKLTLQPSSSQSAALILTDGTLVKTGAFSATRNSTTGNVVVTYTASSDILLGMFVTTTSATANLVTSSAKIIAVTPGASFTYQMPTGTTATGSLTGFTLTKSLIFLGGGITRFQQTTTDAAPIAAGSLILGNNDGLNNTGAALYAVPQDGELVFNTVLDSSKTALTPKYLGGGNLFQVSTNVLKTSGSFTVGGTLTAATISATNYGLAAADIPVITLGTGTSGNYVASVTSGNSLISVSGTGEGAAVVLTADTSPSFTGLITGSGGAELSGAVDLNSTLSATSLSGTSSITNSQDVRIFFSTGGGLATWRVFRDTSSERYKTNIVYVGNSDSILDVQPVTYHDKVQFEEIGAEAPRQSGFLAEDMAENADGRDYVVFTEDGTPEAIQYSRLVVPLHSAMRKLRSRIDELETRLAELETGA